MQILHKLPTIPCRFPEIAQRNNIYYSLTPSPSYIAEMDDDLGYYELPEFLLPLLSKSRHNGFLASFSLTPPCGSGWVLLSTIFFWATVDTQLLLVPLTPLRTDFPKQQKGRGEWKGINKAFPGREFLNTPFLLLKSLLHLPASTHSHFSVAKVNQTQRLRF